MAFPIDDYEIRWKNYRSFVDTGWIKIRPITIVIGTNNSGKTSVISPLLLMAQTLASHDGKPPLVTRGPLINAGGFSDFVHNHKTNLPLYFGLRFHQHLNDAKYADIKRPVGSDPPGSVGLSFTRGATADELVLQKLEFADTYERPLWAQTRNSDGTYLLTGRGVPKLKNKNEVKAIKETTPTNFLFSPGATLRKFEYISGDKFTKKYSENFSKYLAFLAFAYEELQNFFLSFAYVGPIRERLKRYYEIAAETPYTVGQQGEHMANLIRLRFKNDKNLNHWIRRFGFGYKIAVKDFDNIFSLILKDKSGAHQINVADAGFGASQVLPLIVQSLAVRRYGLIVAEQPEIHLNPRLQSELADLFVDLAKREQRVIVETHSEHLLLRLRRLIAEGVIDHRQVAVYFVERSKGVSSIRPIAVSENGHISPDEWPKGFFADTLHESLALAAAQSKKKALSSATKGTG